MERIFQQYFYLWGVLIVLPIWVVIIWKKPRSRREVIYMGLIFATASMLLDKYCAIYDYWKPHFIFKDFNFESLLYGFFVGGMSTKIYELVFQKEYVSEKEPRDGLMLIITLASVVLWVLLLLFLTLNTIYLMLIEMLVWTVGFLLYNRKMLALSLMSGVLMLVINIAWYAAILSLYPEVVHDIWFTGNLNGIYLLGVPLEEHLFLFMLGALGSLIFKVLTRVEIA